MQRSKLKLTHWADACHIAANFVNFTPHTSHREVPIFVHRGHISESLFAMSKKNVNEKLYAKVKRTLQKKRDSKKVEMPVSEVLPAATKVWLASEKKKGALIRIPAVVVLDNGHMVLAEKCNQHSGGNPKIVLVHKSEVNVRID